MAAEVAIPAGPTSTIALGERDARTVGSLSLVLARAPRIDEVTVADLVAHGAVAIEVVVSPEVADRFVQAEARLLWRGAAVGPAFAASGRIPRIAMSYVLDRDAALAAAAAIAGTRTELDVEVTVARDGETAVTRVPLHELFEARVVRTSFDIRVVVPGGDGLAPVPRRVEARTTRSDELRLAHVDDRIVTVDRLADPRAERFVGPKQDLDDTTIVGSDESGPLVDAVTAASWPDTKDATRRWYCPDFDVVLPEPGAAFATSPFRFVVTRPTPATLVGSLRFEVAARPRAGLAPVALTALAVSIEVPFTDARTGATTSTAFACAVTREGDRWVATCELAGDWARACYTALANRDASAPGVKVVLQAAFRGFVRQTGRVRLAAGGKTALLPAERVDGAARTVRAGAVEVHLPVESTDPVPGGIIVRAPDLTDADVGPTPNRTLTLARTFTCARAAAVRAPCDRYGAFYVERKDIGDIAIGCSPTLAIGALPFVAYEEITALASPSYRVYRSLQRPGRALVVPTAMRVSRHASQDERAYRPALVVYCTLDAAVPGNARVVFDATFEPDLPAFEQRRLVRALRSLMPEPVLEFPSAVSTADAFHWAVDRQARCDVEAFPFDAHLVHVSFQTDVAGALLLRSMIENGGIVGTWELTLPDGQKLRTTLYFDLEAFAGPWGTGPCELAPIAGGVRATNRIETPVQLDALLVERGPRGDEVSVQRTLAAGQSVDIAVTGAFDRATAIHRVMPIHDVALEEIRSFIEDVRVNVVFVDQLDHAARGIASVEVVARIVGVEPTRRATIGADGVAQLEFLLPLTTYLAGHVLEFALVIAHRAGATTQTAWHRQDLTADGNVVGITAALLP